MAEETPVVAVEAAPAPEAAPVAAAPVAVPEAPPVEVPVAPPVPEPPPITAEAIAAARELLARADALPKITGGNTDPADPSRYSALDGPAPVSVPKGPCLALRTWNKAQCAALSTFWGTCHAAACFNRFITGVRTLLFFAVTGIGSLIASLEGIDLSGVASRVTGLNIQSEDLFLGISIAGFGLRLVTSSSAFKRWRQAARGDGEAPGIGSGDVDEPDQPSA